MYKMNRQKPNLIHNNKKDFHPIRKPSNISLEDLANGENIKTTYCYKEKINQHYHHHQNNKKQQNGQNNDPKSSLSIYIVQLLDDIKKAEKRVKQLSNKTMPKTLKFEPIKASVQKMINEVSESNSYDENNTSEIEESVPWDLANKRKLNIKENLIEEKYETHQEDEEETLRDDETFYGKRPPTPSKPTSIIQFQKKPVHAEKKLSNKTFTVKTTKTKETPKVLSSPKKRINEVKHVSNFKSLKQTESNLIKKNEVAPYVKPSKKLNILVKDVSSKPDYYLRAPQVQVKAGRILSDPRFVQNREQIIIKEKIIRSDDHRLYAQNVPINYQNKNYMPQQIGRPRQIKIIQSPENINVINRRRNMCSIMPRY